MGQNDSDENYQEKCQYFCLGQILMEGPQCGIHRYRSYTKCLKFLKKSHITYFASISTEAPTADENFVSFRYLEMEGPKHTQYSNIGSLILLENPTKILKKSRMRCHYFCLYTQYLLQIQRPQYVVENLSLIWIRTLGP